MAEGQTSQSKVSPREPCAVRYSKMHGGSRAKLQPTTWQRHHAAAKHEFPTPEAGWVSVPCSSATAVMDTGSNIPVQL